MKLFASILVVFVLVGTLHSAPLPENAPAVRTDELKPQQTNNDNKPLVDKKNEKIVSLVQSEAENAPEETDDEDFHDGNEDDDTTNNEINDQQPNYAHDDDDDEDNDNDMDEQEVEPRHDENNELENDETDGHETLLANDGNADDNADGNADGNENYEEDDHDYKK